jgi:hypothetical protein
VHCNSEFQVGRTDDVRKRTRFKVLTGCSWRGEHMGGVGGQNSNRGGRETRTAHY